jgi:hypothetical protein
MKTFLSLCTLGAALSAPALATELPVPTPTAPPPYAARQAVLDTIRSATDLPPAPKPPADANRQPWFTALTPQQENDAYQRWLDDTFHIDHSG